MEITGATTHKQGRPRALHCDRCGQCLTGIERAMFGHVCELSERGLELAEDMAFSIRMLQIAVQNRAWLVVAKRVRELWRTWSKLMAAFAQLRNGHMPDGDDQYTLPLTAV